MTNFILNRRDQTNNSTISDLLGPDGKFVSYILERGLRNPDGHPRIAGGQYKVMLRPLGVSEFDKTLSAIVPGYKGIPLLCDVPGRTGIEIHPANRVQELLGCLAPASGIITDGNGDYMSQASRGAFTNVYAALLNAMAHSNVFLIVNDIPAGAVA